MRRIIVILSIPLALISCTCTKKSSSTSSNTSSGGERIATDRTDRTAGKVSHQYRSSGCPTVIIVSGENPMVLIPKDNLGSQFDVDGLEVLFHYHPLRMPQPQGCATGIPAEITDVAKK